MFAKIDIEDFLAQSENHLVIDVRSPKEFAQAHIPNAISLPLFSDEERAAVGTLYKQQGRESAMMLGLKYYGTNMQRIISDLQHQTHDKRLFIHCWRGGMRSGVVAYMLDLFGYKVSTLNKGYKSFRTTVLESFSKPKKILILGGRTGSAKTEVIKSLREKNENVIDLEALAHHKGSAYGGIGESTAPSQEMFENELYMQFRNMDLAKPVWLEDESQRIGIMNLPNALWDQMRNAKVIYLEVPFEERLNYLVKTYGSLPLDALRSSTLRIQKRLGGLATKNTLQFLEEKNYESAFEILLKYYDKYYERATAQRNPENIETIKFDKIDPENIADKILTRISSQHKSSSIAV